MSAKNYDNHNRWRNKTVAFRVSAEEDLQLETYVSMSGLTKQDYITRRLLCKDVVVQGNPRVFKALRDQFNAVLEDYADIPLKRERMKKMKADPYYNALQVKYAYAVTCHKAQGGQWKNVFIDQGYMSDEYLSPDYFRWLYTAFTRATGTLYLVNYPQEQTE